MKVIWMTASVGLCTLAGLYVADRFAQRCRVLDDMLRLCRRLRLCGSMGTDDVVQCIKAERECCDNAIMCDFLSCFLQLLSKGQSAAQAWCLAAQRMLWKNRRRCGVTREEFEVLLRVGDAMGTFLCQQQSSLQAIEGELERLLLFARQEKTRCASMYAKLGLIAGVAAAILIWLSLIHI